ncbi:MAG: hypothetical protein JXR47_07150 [Thiotrichales bacterium]|nr:hypothetical protein [Thiotrichales bacterium]
MSHWKKTGLWLFIISLLLFLYWQAFIDPSPPVSYALRENWWWNIH